MNISATSLSNGRVAQLLLNNLVASTLPKSSIPTSSALGDRNSTIGDSINLSQAATTALNNQISTLPLASAPVADTVSPATGNEVFAGSSSLSPQDNYNDILLNAFDAVEPQGSTTFTFSAASGNQPIITGALAGALNGLGASGSVTPQPGESAAALNFAAVYGAQQADGAVGRFYNGTNVDEFTQGFTAAQQASFITAYNNKTLDIQSASDSAGVTWTGTSSTTFTETAIGGGGSSGGSGSVNTVASQKINQYVVVTNSPFFGPVVVSWGGPPTPQSS